MSTSELKVMIEVLRLLKCFGCVCFSCQNLSRATVCQPDVNMKQSSQQWSSAVQIWHDWRLSRKSFPWQPSPCRAPAAEPCLCCLLPLLHSRTKAVNSSSKLRFDIKRELLSHTERVILAAGSRSYWCLLAGWTVYSGVLPSVGGGRPTMLNSTWFFN